MSHHRSHTRPPDPQGPQDPRQGLRHGARHVGTLPVALAGVLALAASLAGPAHAQSTPTDGFAAFEAPSPAQDRRRASTLLVATGLAGGTYSAMLRELSEVCSGSSQVPLTEQRSSGTEESLDSLLANEVSAAFLQADVLLARAQNEKLDAIRTLAPLHPEPLHLLVLDRPVSDGSWLGHLGAGLSRFGLWGRQRLVDLRRLDDLRGRRVAVWGGARSTAELLNAKTGLKLQPVLLDDADSALAALQARQVDAVLAVGGAPLPWVRKLDRRVVRLLPITEPWAGLLGSVYTPTRVSYANLDVRGLPTVATQAVLAVRNVPGSWTTGHLVGLRDCLRSPRSMATLRGTTGYHVAWSDVDPVGKPQWPWFAPR
ncbi:MAG: hypothetical protein KA896_09895 [Leptothrix sp. (in: Bacteria)]|jgi:TRAP-type uncharacterized transport system substrate-binding protein|nr:hypothetical protein [Leptothrix sp. (in: b-proteobacteria)]MBP7520739.1 hypothetical protein [Leptothrix sp. (in: b-proteobacteria)]HQY07574.1 hypothetical protein [Burkholderiaceae bacterium]